MKSLFIGLCALVLVACSNFPVKPREAIAGGYTLVETVSEAVLIAKRDGHIDAEKRNELMDEVDRADAMLDAAAEAVRQGDNADGKIAEARAILLVVKGALPNIGVK